MSTPNISSEQSQALYNQYQSVVQQIQILDNQLAQIGSVVDELTMNLATVDGLMIRKDETEIILPLGGLLFIKADLKDKNELLLNIGSETIIPATFEKGKELLEDRYKEMQDVYQKLSKDKVKIEEIASQLQNQLNQINKTR
ncbi:MAG: Prefoldin subunit alpha [Candidatus Heimdallarchaeota archaeon LC_2]|nr:MAG: Prefoldin subunit alpha [Candidatus Heimdallarchaeota archaeon LC_2]